jgi:hypothetical protein
MGDRKKRGGNYAMLRKSEPEEQHGTHKESKYGNTDVGRRAGGMSINSIQINRVTCG